MNLIRSIYPKALAATAIASVSLLTSPGGLRADEKDHHNDRERTAHVVEHRVVDHRVAEHHVVTSPIVRSHPVNVVHRPGEHIDVTRGNFVRDRHVDIVRGHVHLHPRWTLTYGNGYRGRGFYYGPPSLAYYTAGPDIAYFANQDDVPSEYLSPAPADNQDASPVAAVQSALSNLGYYAGAVDGEDGPMTSDAISHYQSDKGLPVTGGIDQNLLQALGID